MIIVKLSLWESRNAASGLQICELELRVCPYAFVFVLIHPSEFYELAISLHFRPHSRGAVEAVGHSKRAYTNEPGGMPILLRVLATRLLRHICTAVGALHEGG